MYQVNACLDYLTKQNHVKSAICKKNGIRGC